MSEFVTISEIVQKLKFTVKSGVDFISKRTMISDLSRPGLELTGYFDFYPSDRIQVLGRTEISYIKSISHMNRMAIFEEMCQKDTPAFLITRDLEVPPELMAVATSNGIPVISSSMPTSQVSSMLEQYLSDRLAERISVHGVFVEIYGLGVLITGESGIGKSETALELLKRGHLLVADDRVEIHQLNQSSLIGEPPEILLHLLEIRGLGIIDVMSLFGVGAVRDRADINLKVELLNWDDNNRYDRIGAQIEGDQILGIEVPRVKVPVRVGRDIPGIIEAAAMNYRAKLMGFDAAKKFDDNLSRLIAKNSALDQENETAEQRKKDHEAASKKS
ncbi:HPr(Ser) kinase/phosphatase [Xylocopilactobacillus apicola]|uniref:HPr kinase/phosphorylase n=1 Tax=Xylocopilactobacillus apicola TaxID=2932184 RepID=A0AAU9D6G7_9LACO|nr:HPr(Ser) kinase/phosphatase [Xylocopilactobacillus apicola]BDR57956.1 HPr kinase/phosphorylase [Xylocopilactobacillus apicola]